MSEEGNFELLRAFVTTTVNRSEWAKTLTRIRQMKQLLKGLEKPVKIRFQVDDSAAVIREQLKEVKRAAGAKPIKAPPIQTSVKVDEQKARADIDAVIAYLGRAVRQLRVRLDLERIAAEAAAAAKLAANQMNAYLGAHVGDGMAAQITKSLQRAAQAAREGQNKIQAIEGPTIDPATGRKLKEQTRAISDAYMGMANSVKQSLKDVKRSFAHEQIDVATGEAKKSVDRLANAYLGVGRAAKEGAREAKQAFRNVNIDLVTGADRAMTRLEQRFNALRAAGKTRSGTLDQYVASVRQARETVNAIRAQNRAREEGVRNARRIAAEQRQLESRRLSQLRTYYSRYAEIAGKGLFEIRRQISGFGVISAILSRSLTRQQIQFANLNANLRRAFQSGNRAQIRAAGDALRDFGQRVSRTANALANIHAAVAIATTAFKALRVAANIALAPIRALAGAVVSLSTRVAGMAWGAFRAGIRSLLAPTLMVISAFRRMASYLPLIFSYGLISWIKSAVTEFSTFQENIGRAVAQMQVFGRRGKQAMEQLGDRARQISLQWLVDQQELAKAAEELARGGIAAGLRTAEEKVAAIRRELENVALLSFATGFDPQEIAKGITVIRAQYGLVGKEVDDLADMMLYLQSIAPITFRDLNKLMQNAGAAGRLARLEWEQLAASGTKIMQTVPSGSKAGTALARGMLKMLDPTREAREVMRELGTEVENYLDKSRQAFRTGGWSKFIQNQSDAWVGVVDVLKQVGFRAREFANIFDFSVKGDKNARQTIDDIVAGMREAARTDFAKQFAAFLRDNTLFGVLRRAKVEIEELKFAFTETFMPIITRVVTGFNNLVSALSKWIRTSGAARTIQAKLLQLWDRINKSLVPILNNFAKFSALVNATLIAGVVRLATIIAEKLLPKIDEFSKKIQKAFALPEGALDSWSTVANTIALMFNNIDRVMQIGVQKAKFRMAQVGLAIITALNSGAISKTLASFSHSVGSIVDKIARSVVPVARFMAVALISALDAAIETVKPAYAKSFGRLADSVLNKMLNIKAGLTGKNKVKVRFFEPEDAKADVENFNNAGQAILGAAILLKRELAQEFSLGGMGEALETGLDGVAKKLEEIKRAAGSDVQFYQSLLKTNLDDQIDKLDAQAKEMVALNERMQRNARKRQMQAEFTSRITGIEEFSKILQEGSGISQQQLEEQRRGANAAESMDSKMGRMLELMGGRNPAAIGQAALIGG